MPPSDPEFPRWFSEQVQVQVHEPMLRAWLKGRFGAQVVSNDIAETVRGIRTPAVRGLYLPHDALARLVANTGLAVVPDE